VRRKNEKITPPPSAPLPTGQAGPLKIRGGRGSHEFGGRDELFNQKGVALIIVLWVMVMLIVVALNYLNVNRWTSASTRNLKEETISYYMAMSGYHEALNYLMSDKDASIDFIDIEGNFRVDMETPTVTGKRTTEAGEVDIQITDEDSRVNINTASSETLKKLFGHAGVKEDELNVIVDSILDWKDPDKEHHLSGAEDEYYEGLEEPYKTKNAFFDVPEELALVKGIKPEYMTGSEDGKSLLPLITTFSKGTYNINTVSKEIMQFLGLNEFEIEAILKQRNSEAGGLRFVPPEFAAYGMSAGPSNNLRIEVKAAAAGSKMTSTIVTVFRRLPQGSKHKIQTLYWRESAENNRS
jgi:general secretion pathway protein K